MAAPVGLTSFTASRPDSSLLAASDGTFAAPNLAFTFDPITRSFLLYGSLINSARPTKHHNTPTIAKPITAPHTPGHDGDVRIEVESLWHSFIPVGCRGMGHHLSACCIGTWSRVSPALPEAIHESGHPIRN